MVVDQVASECYTSQLSDFQSPGPLSYAQRQTSPNIKKLTSPPRNQTRNRPINHPKPSGKWTNGFIYGSKYIITSHHHVFFGKFQKSGFIKPPALPKAPSAPLLPPYSYHRPPSRRPLRPWRPDGYLSAEAGNASRNLGKSWKIWGNPQYLIIVEHPD